MSSTGQIVGGVIGTVVGMWAGYPMLGAQLGILAGGLADPPKGPTTVGPRLSDLTIQTSTYGAVIPRVYGTDAFSGNVFWLEGNAIKETMVKKKSGGKGGGSKSTSKTWVNTATFAVGLCQGPIAGIRRIWIKGELFYDAGSSDPSTIAASNLAAEGFQVYLGTDTQAPDPRIQADVGAANCPAWRGLAYLVFYDLPLAKYGDALMGAQVKVEVVVDGSVNAIDSSTVVTTDSYKRGVKWDGSRWYGIGYDNRKVIFSTDGTTWTTVTLSSGAGYTDIMYNGDVYIAVTDGTPSAYARSTDLVTWTYGDMPGASWIEWRCITLGPSKQMLFIGYDNIGGMSPGWVCQTADGITWTAAHDLGFPVSRDVACVWNGSVWCMGYEQATGPVAYFAYSDAAGLIWTQVVAPGSVDTPSGICANGSRLLAFGFGSSSDYYSMISDDNGATWGSVTTLPSGAFRYWNTVAWNGLQYVSVTENGDHWLSSTDGTTWDEHTLSFPLLHYGPPAWNGVSWAVTTKYTPATYEGIARVRFFGWSVIIPSTILLSAIVADECVRSGLLTAVDIDVADLTSTVRGYLVASTGTIRSALEPLQAAWPFDVVQRGYKIKFLPRGGSSAASIPLIDLDARGGTTKPGISVTRSRLEDFQLPKRVTIKHVDYNREYATGEQYAARMTTQSVNMETIELPIVMTSGEAAGKAETLLYLRWLERFDVSFSIPGTYNQLEPGDVVTLETPEGDISLRLVAINYTSDGRLECRAKYNNAAIYTPAALASSPIVTGPSTLPLLGPTTSIFLDVPYMHPAQADPSFLMAMYGSSDTWPGAVLVRTDDYGSTWTEIQGFSSPGAAIGSASNTIGAVDSRVWDKGSILSVSMLNGELFDATEIAVLNGGNHFAYGAPGRWEIIGVQKCTLVSAESYKLSDMLRGRKGTEWAMSMHAVGDKVVALSETDVTTIGMSSSAIGLERTYRAVTLDMEVEGAADQLFTYQGVNLECLSPVYFTGYVVAATSDWSFSWIRRSRTDGEWRDLVDVGLGETTEAYELDIFTDNTYTTVKRTITATSPNCLYTSAQQVADFGSNQATVYAKVYQMSSIVGRGYPATW